MNSMRCLRGSHWRTFRI